MRLLVPGTQVRLRITRDSNLESPGLLHEVIDWVTGPYAILIADVPDSISRRVLDASIREHLACWRGGEPTDVGVTVVIGRRKDAERDADQVYQCQRDR